MRHVRIIASMALLVVAVLFVFDRADTAKAPSGNARDRLLGQVRRPQPRASFHVRGSQQTSSMTDSSPVTPSMDPASISARAITPPSPGLAIATTWLDMQHTHSLGKQIIRYPEHDYVIIGWSAFPDFDTSGMWDKPEVRLLIYRLSTGTLIPGFGGAMISWLPLSLGQYVNVDAEENAVAVASYHQREGLSIPSVPFIMFTSSPGNTFYYDFGLYPDPPCAEALWPKFSSHHRSGVDDLVHVIALAGPTCGTEHLYYARFDGDFWSTLKIIDSTVSRGYIVAVDQNSDKVAIVMHDDDDPGFNGANNIVCYESSTTGLGWLDGTELGPSSRTILTNYADTLSGPQAWRHIDAAYDNAGKLHIIWDEQALANQTSNVTIRHWSQIDGVVRPVAAGFWPPTGAQNRLNLTNLSLGIGDGSTACSSSPGGNNSDFLYVLYTKFGGLTGAERGDTSSAGYPNGELCMTISMDGGGTWSSSVNLTNTQTPDCNPSTPGNECRSEDWGTISKIVSNIEIAYISDHDAGSALLGEGTYQPNDVMYLRIDGGTADAIPLCPPSNATPVFHASITADVVCEYHAAPGALKNDEVLTIINTGEGELAGEVSVLPGAPWLGVVGGGSYAIPSGDPDLTLPVVMDATSLAEGYYTGVIRVTHNDPGQLESYRDFPIAFFVISDFNCSERAIISTGVE